MAAMRVNGRLFLPRCWQFSLQTLVAVTFLACLACAIYGWRERRNNQLLGLIVRFNAALDDGQSSKALLIAEYAARQFPGERHAVFMLEKGRLVHRMSSGEPIQAYSPDGTD